MKEFVLNCVTFFTFETTEWVWIKLVLGSTLKLLRSEFNFCYVFSITPTLLDPVTCVYNTQHIVGNCWYVA